ncbi:YebC/PmpR family DNA-binding transcriptional regulator [Helicobacter sp. 16-1353]|uniref:YebC/PmpR family DNA-binding transcriptional regulator n=1 Tax=Helicobacter sp. 16-1353 TaxID=2004996 RepID=UPI000DCF034F|nr:YebC/PmpR family DNA-binding transcriptional regulator [Helicobacter sp. 16-1353]RAX54635.1 YebC/PmpR family DNA-binding transcriptional regulator [Helicobacter sp. 16-1353]
MGRAFEYRRASKEKRWDKMSKLFPKLAKAITMAAKEGGSDPEMNAKLRAAVLNAKAQNLPKDNIEAAIKRASGKDSNLNEVTYEAKAAFGTMMIIECATDNPTRTIANLKSYCNKHNAQIIPNGSLEFMFERKAVFEIESSELNERNLEEIELELIDFGLENLEIDDDKIYIYGDYKDFGSLSNGLKKLNISPLDSSLRYIANSPINLSETESEEIEKLLDRIEEDDDVQNIWINIS